MNCYFDHSATTPVDLAVIEWMNQTQSTVFGNPSSSHAIGRKGKHILESARFQLAESLGCSPKEIIFTGSGTEANNLVLHHVASQKKKHIITSSIEHPAILKTLNHLKPFGITFTIIPVDQYGAVDPKDIEKAIQSDTGLISIMAANNEVGTVQPIETISHIAKNNHILFHSDGVQALGKIRIQTLVNHCDLISFSSHKFYGPKGVAFLIKKESVKLNPFIVGGGQESNLRGGTENIVGIGAMSLAAEKAIQSLDERSILLTDLESLCIAGLKDFIPDVIIHGNMDSHIPGLISFAIPGIDNQKLLTQLDQAHIYASSGSACHSGISTPSEVLIALGVDEETNLSTIRISFGKDNTLEQVQYFLDTLKTILQL